MSREARSLHEAIEATVELAAANASEQGLGLICKIAPECRDIHGFNAWCVTQIITNLISNALRYTETGAVTVTAACERNVITEKFSVSVSDPGPGIAPDIFEAMFALPDQREILPGGDNLGFGLVISRQLCEFFDGKLDIHTEHGVGTTATLTAPIEDDVDSNQDNSVLTAAFRNTFALIIDSDVAARRLLEAHLRSWGLYVMSVLDKDSALKVISDEQHNGRQISMLFVSHEMSEPDLTEILAELESSGNPDAMLVMTGADLTTGRLRIKHKSYGDATLTTPVKASELFDCISKHPFVAANVEQDSDTDATASAQAADSSKQVPTILLVEDNIVNQCVASEILKRIGVDVSVANNGLEAVAALDRNSYDFVFMDCQMPEMDGFEATRQIRARPALADLPVVALTANALSGDRQRCIDAGMSDYLTKPFTKQQLESMLAKWLGESRIPSLQPAEPVRPVQSLPIDKAEVALIDHSALDEIRRLDTDGESSIFDEIVAEYRVSSKDLMASIEHAVTGDDADGAARAAHALKSSSAALGLRHFGELCARMEQIGRQNEVNMLSELWPALHDTYQQSLAALETATGRKVA